MKNVKELYYQLNKKNNTFLDKYPHYDRNDGKIHVLYVAPCLNATGFYRMVLPMLELNKTVTHSAIVTTIHKWNFNKQFDDYDNPIDKRLIEWADYMVFPVIFSPMEYIIKAVNSVKSDIIFVMDIDINYFELPIKSLNASKITEKHKRNLLGNISQMDIVIGVSTPLLKAIDELLIKQYTSHNVKLAYFPNLISHIGTQEIEAIKRNERDRVRIGIIANPSEYYNILLLKNTFESIYNKYSDKCEIVIFGWDGKSNDNKELLENLNIIFEKSVSFLNYYTNVNNLTFDFVLLPLENIPYNNQKSFVKYLEMSTFGIPIIASKILPNIEVIDDGETGMLANTEQEWIDKISKLIKDKSYCQELGKAAFKNVWSNYSYTQKNINFLKDIFN